MLSKDVQEMREKIKDRGRLEHILNAIDSIMNDKELYTLGHNPKRLTRITPLHREVFGRGFMMRWD